MLVSIIIPYFERKHHLEQTLSALLDNNFKSYEVIVVDDGSDEIIDELIPKGVHLIRTEHKGAAAARNTGMKYAQGEVIIFLDCDILVDAHFVCNHYIAHTIHDNHIILGQRLHLDQNNALMTTKDTRSKLLDRYHKKVNDLKHPWFMAFTCNLSLRSYWAKRLPFDENYLAWGLEDSEWSYRLFKQGCQFAFDESLTVKHLYHDRTMTNKRFEGWKNNLFYTLNKHPELQDLSHFIKVFDPNIKQDYFETYDKFEEIPCLI